MLRFQTHRLLNETTGEPEAGAPRPTLNPRQAAMQQIAQQHNERVAPDFQAFDEATGQIVPKEPVQQVQAEAEQHVDTVADEPQAAATEVDVTKPRTRKIIVHGNEIEVSEDKITEAGIRTLQKQAAADKLLQDAAEKERRAEALLQQAQQRLSPQGDATQVPSKDAPKPELDPSALDAYLERKFYHRDAEKAVSLFVSEFPEIAGDPHLMGIAARLEDERLAHAAATGSPLGDPVEAYRKHGLSVRDWLQERTGGKPPAVPQQDKQERKRSITTVQAANATAPKPEAKKPATREEVIEGMRVARQGRPVMRTQRI